MTRDPDRIAEVLIALEEAWRRTPALNLGQLLINAVREPHQRPGLYQTAALMFRMEDEKWVKALRQWPKLPPITS